jgi:PKD repeat protein
MMILLPRLCLLALVAVSLLTLVSCKEDDGTSSGSRPTISSINPAQVFPGQTNVRATIIGTNFTGFGAVNMGPGIEILKTKLISSTEISIRFTVQPNAAPGPRTISVSTLAGTGELDGTFSVAENRAPIAAFTVNPPNAAKNVQIAFDGSGSSDPDGTIQLFQWDFGDGAKAEGRTTTHEYSSSGNFTVTLTVTDNRSSKGNTTRDVQIENVIPPVAHFNIQPQEGSINTRFEFDGSSSTDSDGRIQSYIWEFGDGNEKSGARVSHKFSKKGDFSVRLTVTDNDGLQGTRDKSVKIIGQPPIASFTVTPSTGSLSTIFTFDASGSRDDDGRIVEYRWLIEGNTFTNKIPQYSFTRTGSHEVRLTVTDDDGETDTTERIVTVHDGGGDDDDDDDDDPPPAEGRCTEESRLREPFFFTVTSENRNSKVITGRFHENVTCKEVFYFCGDVRKGGIRPGERELWMGTICAMYSLGNNSFRIELVDGRDWIEVGEDETYVWPQLDCNPNVVCRGF